MQKDAQFIEIYRHENSAIAGMVELELKKEGIPCFVKLMTAAGDGVPSVFGSFVGSWHVVFVSQEAIDKAREILDSLPHPEDIKVKRPNLKQDPLRRNLMMLYMAIVIIVPAIALLTYFLYKLCTPGPLGH
jgi:hypothetical protein